jgi:small subunit ribosomal protein S20
MPILKSSAKDLRRTARRRERNKAAMAALRTAVKKVHAQIDRKDGAAARAALAVAVPVLDRAADSGAIHKNLAARTKSRLTLHIAKLAATKP